MLADKVILLGYWFLATGIIIWGDFIKGIKFEGQELQVWPCVKATILCLVAAAIIYLSVHYFSVHKVRGNKLLFFYVPILIIGLLVPHLYGNFGLRAEFNMAVACASVIVYSLVQYYENANYSNKQSIVLMHQRYLEYFKLVIWAVFFGLVSYLYWEVTVFGSGNEVTFAVRSHIAFSFIQLLCVVGGGVFLIFYGVNKRLREFGENA